MPNSTGNNEGRKRTYSELQDVYAGPEDFMEAGVRGFLITTVPDKEELATDQAMKMLRKACVKLYGGYKPVKNITAMFSCGYIAMDFMDPEAVTVLPNPDAKAEAEAQDQENVPETGGDEAVKDENKETEEKMQTEENGDNKDQDIKEEKEDKDAEKKMETGEETQDKDADMETEKQEDDVLDQDSKIKEESKKDGEKEKEVVGNEKDKDGDSKTKEGSEKKKEEDDKSKSKSKSSKDGDRRNSREHKRKRKQEENTPKWPLMKATYKFKSFRTELRNILFVKSDVPDPVEVVTEIMTLLDKRRPLKADAIYQLLPIQGICNYDYWELEVMSRRVLAPYFKEDQEVAPSFGILMFDKMCDPGADVLTEIVRSAIWSLNPDAWQNHPICQPTVVIHLELIGSKIALSAMPNFMRFRQYSPFFVSELGEGKPEVQDDLDKVSDTQDKDKERSDKDRSESRRSDSKGKSRSRSHRSHKDEESPSGKGRDKDSKDKSSDRDKDNHSKSNDDDRKDSKKSKIEKIEEGEKEEKKEEGEEKPKEEAVEAEEENKETKGEEEEKKTPPRRGGRRAASQKKKN